jgi:hypothetical protein
VKDIPLKYRNSEEFLNKLRNIYYLLIALPMGLFVLIFLNMKDRLAVPEVNQDLAEMLLYVLSIIALINVASGYLLYYRNMKNLQISLSLKDKLQVFLNASILLYAALTAATLIIIAGLYITKNSIFAFFYVILLFLLSIGSPTYHRISRAVKLNQQEKEIWFRKKELEGNSNG